MASRKIWLWVRQDGAEPRVIAVGSPPPGPGAVYELDRMGAEDARSLYQLATEALDTSDAALKKLAVAERDAVCARAGQIRAANLSLRPVDLGKEVIRG